MNHSSSAGGKNNERKDSSLIRSLNFSIYTYITRKTPKMVYMNYNYPITKEYIIIIV